MSETLDTAEKAEQEEQKSSYETFEEFLDTLDDGAKDLYTQHTSGLKSALEKEREERRNLADQLKVLQSETEKGSELEKKLSETLAKLEKTEQRAQFTEGAQAEGCSNAKAAYALAVTENLFTDGKVDWKQLKELAPELFKVSASTNAGTRTKPAVDINAQLRAAAGYTIKD